jgi:hypothetical protein
VFQDVHPTETGGDGKFLAKFATDKPGAVVDKRIRCAQCGLPFRTDMDVKGDTKDSPGIAIADLEVSINNDQEKIPIHLKGLSAFSASSRTISEPTVSSGCRFCGTYNPTGKQSKEFDTASKDMSGR